MMGERQATAILFPGQGVGDPSSRELVEHTRPDLLELATEEVGEDPFARISDGTRFAQPAVYCASIAGFELLGRPAADYFAGHSLGEIGALAAAGAIDDRDGLRAVVRRGELMEGAAHNSPPGGMAAVGAERRSAEALADDFGLVVANANSAEQFVLSGESEAIDLATHAAKHRGLRAKRLAVSGAFHTKAIREAVDPFRSMLSGIEFRETNAPVISSATARPFDADPREALASALVEPVRWINAMRKLRQLGATRFVDVGPGKVLAGLIRRTISDAEVETLASQEAAVA
jgi:[acyl-carrier-protein] S-malonyltransferase